MLGYLAPYTTEISPRVRYELQVWSETIQAWKPISTASSSDGLGILKGNAQALKAQHPISRILEITLSFKEVKV